MATMVFLCSLWLWLRPQRYGAVLPWNFRGTSPRLRSRVYEILQPGQRPLAGVAAEPVVTFAAAAALEDAVSRGQHLAAAIQTTRSAVAGYWLNIPSPGARCPTCQAARPDIAIQVLRWYH